MVELLTIDEDSSEHLSFRIDIEDRKCRGPGVNFEP